MFISDENSMGEKQEAFPNFFKICLRLSKVRSNVEKAVI